MARPVVVPVQVSPGFRPRPSLSVEDVAAHGARDRVSPGFRPRPSLSADGRNDDRGAREGVAGVQAPAFVERGRSAMRSSPTRQVSPGFRPRPSLSV